MARGSRRATFDLSLPSVFPLVLFQYFQVLCVSESMRVLRMYQGLIQREIILVKMEGHKRHTFVSQVIPLPVVCF